MTQKPWLTDDVQRYLDGEGGAEPAAREPADRFAAVLREWHATQPVPGSGVDRAVMAAVRERGQDVPRAAVMRWLVRPSLRVSPLAAAAALAVIVGASTWLTAVAVREPGTPTLAAAPAGNVLVRFELLAPDARQVSLAGTFNQWNDSALTFSQNAETGVWSLTVPLPPGEHVYNFVVDGREWVPDPRAHAQVDDGFGNTNSVIVVGPRGVVRS